MTKLPDISEHLHIKEGFCHPDWAAIAGVIETSLPESGWESAWEEASRSWVTRIKDQLGGEYQVYETTNFMILSEAPTRVIKEACRTFEDSLKQILASFGGVALDGGYGKHVVMMFANIEDYYGYISYFGPDGDTPMSGGVCLGGEGYVHFALPTLDYSSYRTVLVHELTHGCLGHLPLPVWLNEALAMRMEQVICRTANFHLDREIFERHVAHWNEETIQQFWSGESWEIPGDSFELSYNLAQILWRKIEVDLTPERVTVLEFVVSAEREDAGNAACLEIFEVSLGDLVTDFLGDGAWEPEPTRWPDRPGLGEAGD